VANRLEEKGLSLAVINARFARPLDEELIISQAQKPGRFSLWKRVFWKEALALPSGSFSTVRGCIRSGSKVLA